MSSLSHFYVGVLCWVCAGRDFKFDDKFLEEETTADRVLSVVEYVIWNYVSFTLSYLVQYTLMIYLHIQTLVLLQEIPSHEQIIPEVAAPNNNNSIQIHHPPTNTQLRLNRRYRRRHCAIRPGEGLEMNNVIILDAGGGGPLVKWPFLLKLVNKTVFISGASRGIGREIALKLAKDKANIIIAAKTAEPHPKLPGTIFTVAKEVEAAGGKALPCLVDIRDEKQVSDAVEKAVAQFGGIDIVINNASAISLTKTTDTDMKKYDLMHQINGRGTFLVTKVCAPYLRKGQNPHILNLSPPISLQPRWFQNHVAYTMAKYNMSLCALGWAEEFRSEGIAANCIWPATAIFTAAMEMLGGGSGIKGQCRRPEIMADAAYAILCRDSTKNTGNFYIDEDVLREEGITDFAPYAYDKNVELMPDFFLEENLGSVKSSQYIISRGAAPPPPKSPPAGSIPNTPSPAAAAGAADGNSEIVQIFNKIKGLMTPELVKATNAVFQFDVKGDKGGLCFLDLKNGEGSTGPGQSPSKSDVTITVGESDFVKLFSGKLSPTSAYMMGKLKLKGDITKAMVLDKLMGKLKSKL